MDPRFSLPLQTKFTAPTAKGEFSGLASTFGNVDMMGDIVLRGAFVQSLADHKSAGTAPAMLWHHQTDEPIGRWIDLHETEAGLAVKGQLTLGVKRAQEARALMLDGALSLSIGFMLKESHFDKSGNRLLRVVDLWEISAVSLPANPKATIGTAKNVREFEHKLRNELGFSVREAKKLSAGGWRALQSKDESNEIKQVLAQLRASANRYR